MTSSLKCVILSYYAARTTTSTATVLVLLLVAIIIIVVVVTAGVTFATTFRASVDPRLSLTAQRELWDWSGRQPPHPERNPLLVLIPVADA